MKLTAEHDGEKFDIELRTEGSKTLARINDREYELEISEPEPNIYLFKTGGRVFEFYAAPGADASTTHVSVKGVDLEVRYTDPKRLRGSSGIGEHADGVAEIRTAMPGKVVRIISSVGTAVENGDGVVVVEAMKMQNELKSPKAGLVKEIRTSEGATVAAGDVLAIIE